MVDLKILKIEILTGSPVGTDRIYIHTFLPSPFPKGVSNDMLILSCETQKGKAVEYAKKYFDGYPIVHINTDTGEKNDIY